MRRGLLTAGLATVLTLAGSHPGAAQSGRAVPKDRAPVQRHSSDRVPESTTMAVLATSLVGLFLAGIQKRRKG